jgi:hypothetical protein
MRLIKSRLRGKTFFSVFVLGGEKNEKVSPNKCPEGSFLNKS